MMKESNIFLRIPMLVSTCLALTCLLSGTGFGEKPVYRVGLDGVFFYPNRPDVGPDYGSQAFLILRGMGLELGRISEPIDLNLEAHWASGRSTANGDVEIYRVTPRGAFRIGKRPTFYFGAGSGYQLIRVHSDPELIHYEGYFNETRQSITFEPYAGFDFILTKRFGFKLEGRYQIITPNEPSIADGMVWSGGAYLAFGGR